MPPWEIDRLLGSLSFLTLQFRLMQAQAMLVGQRRIELSMRIAELERTGS